MNNMLEAALHYAELGFAVFPLKPRDKTPLTHHGCKDATTDKQQIKKWWNRCPDSNIGLATGAISQNICVIDIDIDEDKGIDGSDTLSEWERNNGRLPDTAIAITGRGGYHYYYRITEPIKNRTNILEGIDFRGDGGYVVAPPSVHSNGNEYEWEYDIDEYDIADADATVMKLLETARAATNLLNAYQPLDVDAIMSEGSRNDRLFRLASHYQAKSLPDDAVRALVEKANREKCTPPLEQEEVDKILGSVLTFNKGLSEEFKEATKKKKQGNKQTIQMMVESIKADENLVHVLRYNTLAYSPWIAGVLPWSKDGAPEQRQWTDVDDAQFQRYMEDVHGYTSADKMLKALSIVMDDNSFSPIVEHLETLRGTWDGKPRMETLLQDFLGADDTELNRAIMRTFMFGAIARAYKPGCQFDYMPIFVGMQGIGKSTFLRLLAMSDVWFDGNFNTVDGDKAVERLRGMWIVEMSELLAMKRTKEVESMKSFITNRSDNYRAPYARRTTARPRQCVFAGSTNKEMFLTDVTGNRRFMPVMTDPSKVKKDLFGDGVHEYFEQAWAEALEIYFRDKPKLVLSKKLQRKMEVLQESFTEEDPRVGIIQEYLDNSPHDRHCVLSIWREAFRREDTPDRKTTNELHDIMRNSITGYVAEKGKKRCRDYGIQRTYFRESAMFKGAEGVQFTEIDIEF